MTKKNAKPPWSAPFWTRLYAGIVELGLQPIGEHPDSVEFDKRARFSGHGAIAPRLFFMDSRDDTQIIVAIAGRSTTRFCICNVRVLFSEPKIVELLTFLQSAEKPKPFPMGLERSITSADDLEPSFDTDTKIGKADKILLELKESVIPWAHSYVTSDRIIDYELRAVHKNAAMGVACLILRKKYTDALKIIEHWEFLDAHGRDDHLQKFPNAPIADFDAFKEQRRAWQSEDLPNNVYIDKTFCLRAREICLEGINSR